jgi:hypothetical protein
MTLFYNFSEKQIKTTLRFSAIEMQNNEYAFIINSIGQRFGIYKNEIMFFSDMTKNYYYIEKREDNINLFVNKFYQITQFEYKFFVDLKFENKSDFEKFIDSCEFEEL